MARAKKNDLILSSLSGKLSGMIIKQYKYGTVISKIPDMSKVKTTRKQKTKRSLFKEAVAYAKDIIDDPKKAALYRSKVKRGKTLYHTAISEFLKKNSGR